MILKIIANKQAEIEELEKNRMWGEFFVKRIHWNSIGNVMVWCFKISFCIFFEDCNRKCYDVNYMEKVKKLTTEVFSSKIDKLEEMLWFFFIIDF